MRTARYGTWISPLSAEEVAHASTRLGGLAVTAESVFWGERRPAEGGRTAVVERRADGSLVDRLAAPWNVRSRAHEYGGGAFTAHQRSLFFSNFADGRVWAQEPGTAPVALTPEPGAHPVAYADLRVDPARNRLLAISEAHREGAEPRAALVAIPLTPLSAGSSPGAPQELAAGAADFYASPTLAPDGKRVAWLTWSHPQMPWDATELWIASVKPDGGLGTPVLVAGGVAESLFQPGFDTHGDLLFASDRSGWWNLYRIARADLEESALDPGRARAIPEALAPLQAEFGRPQWIFGMTTWAEVSPGRLVAAFTCDGLWQLGEVSSGQCSPLELPYSAIEEVAANGNGQVVLLASAPDRAAEVARLAVDDSMHLETLSSPALLPLEAEEISAGEPICFPSRGGRTAHAFYYPPRSSVCVGLPGTQPPLIVKSHGGPTAAADNGFDLAIQFWTTRGFAVVDVNYGGSTGYGRAYRRLLEGQWGVVDVEDCAAAAEFLVSTGRADPERLAIRGGSAGGFTTLAALAFTEVFKAGASHYGVAELESLARDTHKFESRYLDGLVGPYPERIDLYRERSPLNSAHQISCPVIFFQGLDDKVVPPNQAEQMVNALHERDLEVRYVTFEGEGHGFRKAENITRSLEEELAFYRRVLHIG
jgi:dipeptidyl aminopeptidase/acylaminoacyl peptidase